jgi:ABC-type sugar transport system substrate-binding protein
MAAHATVNWGGKIDWVLGLDLPEAGQLVQSRITGAFEGVRSGHPELPLDVFVRIDGRGMRDRKQVSDFLQRHPKDKRILIAAATDSSALGAVDAVREQKRERHVAIVGQDCICRSSAGDATRQVSDDRIGFALDEFLWSQLDPSEALAAARPDVPPYSYVVQNGGAGVFAITQRLLQ